MLSVPYNSYSVILDGQRPHSLSSHHQHVPHASKLKTLVYNKQSSFLVKLTVHDITNVPLVSGSFSVRWKFRGSKGDMGLEPESPTSPTHPDQLTHRLSSSSSLHETYTGSLGDLAKVNNHHHDGSSHNSHPNVHGNDYAGPGGGASRGPGSSVSTTRSSTPGPGAVPPPQGGSLNGSPAGSRLGSGHQASLSTASSVDTRSTLSDRDPSQTRDQKHVHAGGDNFGNPSQGHSNGSETLATFVDHEMARYTATNNNPVPSNIAKFDGDAAEQGHEGEEEDPGSSMRKRDRAREMLHVPHILLHRSENASHSSLSSAFGSLGRKRREDTASGTSSPLGRARSGSNSGSASGSRTRVASMTSIASSMDSTTRTSQDTSRAPTPTAMTRDHPEGIKLDVPLGTVTTVKGRTPVKELEDHGVSWECHIAQLIKIKLRPLDEDTLAVHAKRFAAGGGGGAGGMKEHAKQFGANLIPSSSSAASTTTGNSSPPRSSNGSSSYKTAPSSSQSGTHSSGRTKRSCTSASTSAEPQGWLGGGPTSESGLKLVVYQHVAGMGLETIRSVSTRSDAEDEGQGEMDLDKQGSNSRARSILHPTRTNRHKHRGDHHSHLQDPGIYFGELNLDLAEYASDEGRMGRGGVTRRYLLKGGKTNAMIKLTIELKHILGEQSFITPPLQRGAGITGAIDSELQIDHHLNKLKATENSASSSSVSLAQSQNGSMVSRAPTHEHEQLLRTVSCTTLPPSEQSRTRPKKPPESHFLEPEHQHRFNQLYRRGYRNHGHRAVHDALKSGHRDHHRHRQSAPYTGDWSAEQVIDLIFNPLPVNRIDKVTPFTYYAENAPDDESVGRNEPDLGGQGAETASLAESTNTLQEKRSRKFLHVLGGHGLRSYSSSSMARDENGSGTGEKSRPRWTRGKTKLNE